MCEVCVGMDLTYPKGSLAPAMSTLLCQLTDGRDQAWVCRWQVNLCLLVKKTAWAC